jgi:hypothetical protein
LKRKEVFAMAQTEVVLHWEAARGGSARHKAKSVLRNVSGPTVVYGLRGALDARTKCICRTSAYVDRRNQYLAAAVDPESNADRRATIYYRHPVTLEVHQFTYFDPVAADSELTPQGERLTQEAVEAIVTAINVATGINHTPLYGVVTQSP